MDKDSSKYTAMAISDGRIVDVGNEEILKKYSGEIELKLTGKFIYPGLIDAHSHFYGLGESMVTVDLRGIESEEDMNSKVREFYSVETPSSSTKKSTSVQGRGWDQNLWESKKFPTNVELNKMFPDIPVCLKRIDGHAALVNQKALDMAGIDENSKISGGEFIKENGKLTGVLIDNAVDLVTAKLPEPTKEEKKHAILKAEKECLKYGLTTVCDAGIDKVLIDLYDEMHKSGELQIRIYAMANPTQPTLNWLLENGPFKTDRLHVTSVKYYMDGAMGSRGACLLEDYSDQPGHRGFLLNSIDSLRGLAKILKENNLQLNVHCIGDSTNRVTLKIMAEVLGDDSTSRWRIEHMQLISELDLKYLEQLKIIPSMQPTHASSDFPWVLERIGNDRFRLAYAFKTCLLRSGTIALGTDFPVEEINPFKTYFAAITERGFLEDSEDLAYGNVKVQTAKKKVKPEHLTPYETLRGMTIWAAYAQFEENEKGSLEKNKFADFIVMDQDIFTSTKEDLDKLIPFYVYINGKLVARR